ncbi:DUF2637 domain-containing protein [Micromonospora craniellae]|uniref:DUF2637 domain-containing protein n=1 Tax=Micromonospora craniellae TaxID=2294034 RepID=A0A372FW22_9ACTN|nr:DUF2637 domain-containing protein [Micromonospora craniellae]QOC94073.1 DUF2637 domain-containing protein [Micromonospora craniellae]RFS44746.1 DUF2637 domain-containing protein [Micromonospora craniellae]
MKTTAQRIEGVVLVLIVLVVGGLAGAASFTHVHDWTMANSPAGTGDWFGWANAAISELLPLAALLTIRQRRRTGGPIGYPMFLLVCAVSLSLAAQLAVAKPGLSGWLLSAVPALAFLGLSKLVFSTAPAPTPVTKPDDERRADEPTGSNALPVPVPVPVPANDDQATTVVRATDEEQLRPAVLRPVPSIERRPGLVPVPAAAFTPRNGTPAGSEGDR